MDVVGLGAYVRARREHLGWTQTHLADASGVDRPYLSQIERGVTKLPSADVRRRLAAVLGVRHVDLLLAAGEVAADELPAAGASTGGEFDALVAELPPGMRRALRELVEGWVANHRRAVAAEGDGAGAIPAAPGL